METTLPLTVDLQVNDNIDTQLLPRIGMEFESEHTAYDFYNAYAAKNGFSIRKDQLNKSKKTGEITSRIFVCSKEGVKWSDKRDCLVNNPRAETRTGCGALMGIKFNRNDGKFKINAFMEAHNHPLVSTACSHMLPSQRKICSSHSIEIDLANDSGIALRSSFELMSREVGGRQSLGFLKTDQKNYLRTKRQRMLAFGEAGNILKYFQDQIQINPSFFHAMQLDNEEQITNIFWADAKMIMDYGQFRDVVSFDTTYKLNREHRPFALFVGFNNHRETIVFGAALMYNETADSFMWLFETFLQAMSQKHPKTIFTDQDAAMAKAIKLALPNTYHRLCTWHMMQNAMKHVHHIFNNPGHVRSVLVRFMKEYENEDEWLFAWNEMLDEFNAHDNAWLKSIYDLREKWARPYVRWAWSAGMKSTQLSESINADLKDYLRSDYNLVQFFNHFQRLLNDKRYKENEAEYNLSYRLPRIRVLVRMLTHVGEIYTKAIFEEFQEEYIKSLELCIAKREQENSCLIYSIMTFGSSTFRKVKRDMDGIVSCCCRLFEMRGVLCSHAIKVVKDEMQIMEIPPHYILKRWSRNARSETVQDMHGRDIEVDPKLDQSKRYRSLCSLFNKVSSRASELQSTYELSMKCGVDLLKTIESMLALPVSDHTVEDDDASCPSRQLMGNVDVEGSMEKSNPLLKAKGLKKRNDPFRGKKRMKSNLEQALIKSRKKAKHSSKVNQNVMSYLMPSSGQVSNTMPFLMPPSHQVGVPHPMPWVWNGLPEYTNFQALLQNGLSYNMFQGSQIRSNSTNWSEVNADLGVSSNTPNSGNN